jgi:hypothetical protein
VTTQQDITTITNETAPDSTEIPHLCCPTHRPAGLASRPTVPGEQYWCTVCHEPWQENGRLANPYRPTIIDFMGIGAWVLYLAALLIGCAAYTTWALLPRFPDTDNGRSAAAIVGTFAGVLPWLVLVGINSAFLYHVLIPGAHWVWEYVWGPPLRSREDV